MKIVCDNCSTKYSIADEKVRGKVFKIKCKKCSHIIVVKGNEGGEVGVDSGAGAAEPAAEAPAEAAPAGDGWHVEADSSNLEFVTDPFQSWAALSKAVAGAAGLAKVIEAEVAKLAPREQPVLEGAARTAWRAVGAVLREPV